MATTSKFIADIGIKTDSDLQIGGNTTIDGNATVSGNLTVNGTSTTINATTTSVEDNMLELANANTSSDTLDIGIYGNYDDGLSDGGATEYTGLFRDASDSTWKLFDGLEVAPTTTVNTSGTGYTLADLTVGDLTATTLTATNGLTGSSITYPTSDGTNGQVIKTDGSGTLTFGDIPAGYTDSDARSAISVSGDLSYNSSTGVISYSDSDTTYTDSDARGAISAGTGISYNSSTGVITNTVSNTDTTYSAGTGLSLSGTTFSSTITQYADSDARSAISAGTGISYNSSTGVITNSSTADGITTSGSNTIIQSPDDTSVIHVNNSAEVGIGTVDPTAKLHVDGNMLLNTGSPDLYLGTGNGHYNWRIAAQEVVNKGFEIASGTTAEGSTAPSDTYTTRFTVLGDNGDVVIGNSGGVARRDLGSNTAPVLSLEGTFPAHNLRDTSGTGAFYGINGDTMYLGGHTGTALFNHYVNGSPQLELRINGNTQPNQPSFFCYPSSSFSASGGSLKYTFDSEAHDSNNEYNHTTGKFTAPTAGRYMFLCNLAIQASTSELTYIGIGVRKNNTGSVYFGGWGDKQATSNSHYAQASSSIIMYLAQGDYVELYIELSGTHSVLGGNSGAYTRFCGQLLS
jgi:hypothetical protein